jgi:hypothetical protein
MPKDVHRADGGATKTGTAPASSPSRSGHPGYSDSNPVRPNGLPRRLVRRNVRRRQTALGPNVDLQRRLGKLGSSFDGERQFE